MERSNNSRGQQRARLFDRMALGGLTLGLALYVIPFWREGRLRAAFWLTLASTVLHLFTSRLRDDSDGGGSGDGGGAAAASSKDS